MKFSAHNTYKTLILIIFLTLTRLSALDQQFLEETETLELNGEPLSAELEYIALLEDCIAEYRAGKSPAYNSAVSEFLCAKILELSKFTGENREPLAALESLEHQGLPAPLVSRLTLAEIELNRRLGRAAKIQALSTELNFLRDCILEFPDSGSTRLFRSVAPDALIPLGRLTQGLPEKKVLLHFPLESEDAADLALHFGCSTPLRILSNGEEILQTTGMRSAKADQQCTGIHLEPGLNMLTLECQNLPETDLYLRLSMPDGSALNTDIIAFDTLQAEPAPDLQQLQAHRVAAAPARVVTIANGAEQFFAEEYSRDKSEHRAAYFLGYLLLQRESLDTTSQAAQQLLLNAARYNPESGIYLMAIAEANDESKRFIADREENMRRMSLEKALKLFPENVQALTELAAYYLDSQNSPDRAQGYITRALTLNPKAVLPNAIQYRIYKERGWEAKALELARETAKRDPQNPLAEQLLGRISLADATLADAITAFSAAYAQDKTDSTSLNNLLLLLTRQDELKRVKELASAHLALNPYDLQIRENLLELLSRTQDPQLLSELETALAYFPQNSTFTRLLADYYSINQAPAKALTLYQNALEYNPADIKLRHYLEFKGVIPPSQLTRIDDLQSYGAAVTPERIPPGQDKIYLLSEEHDELNPGGTRNRSKHLVIQILTKNGAASFKHYPIWYDRDTEKTSIESAKVVHPDGSISLAQLRNAQPQGSRGLTVIDLPALDVGDLIELEYSIDQFQPNFFGTYFGKVFRFRNTLPILESRYTLTTPEQQELYYQSSGGAPEPEVTTAEGKKNYTWKLTDLAPIPVNTFSPPQNELSPTVEISTFKDWDALAQWYWQLLKEQNLPTPDIAAKVQEITLNAKNDKEKLEAIYNWITTEVRNNAWEFGVHGFKPYNAGTIFTRRFGDCKDKSTLLCVMAKLAGIDAWPLLLRSTMSENTITGRGLEDFTLPILSHFNHCIAYAQVDGKPYYLDGTLHFRTIESNPSTNAGAKAVIIRPSGAEFTQTPDYAGSTNRWIDYTGIGINGEGTADMDFTIATTGESSMFLRAWFNNPNTWDNVLRAICTERYGHVSAVVVEDFGSNDQLDPDEEMLKGRVRIRDYAQKTAEERIAFSLPQPILSSKGENNGAFPSEFSNYAITSRRSADLILPTLYQIQRHLKIEWPINWKLEQKLPAPVKLDTPFGSLSIEFSNINNLLKLDYTLELKKTRITREEYPEFRKFCFAADKPSRLSFTLIPVE